MELCNIKDS